VLRGETPQALGEGVGALGLARAGVGGGEVAEELDVVGVAVEGGEEVGDGIVGAVSLAEQAAEALTGVDAVGGLRDGGLVLGDAVDHPGTARGFGGGPRPPALDPLGQALPLVVVDVGEVVAVEIGQDEARAQAAET